MELIFTQYLTDNEKKFFDLDHCPILHVESGLKNMNADRILFKDIIHTMIEQEIPTEKTAFIQAHSKKDWDKIERLAHKMKGGSIYTGLIRMHHACKYFEDYYRNEQTQLLEELYQQILDTMDETQNYLKHWLQAE